MDRLALGAVLALGLLLAGMSVGEAAEKPSPAQVVQLLMDGNQRFVEGRAVHPRADQARLKLAGTEDQGNHALATVISCSDSRVPVELLFDQGVMDVFVVVS